MKPNKLITLSNRRLIEKYNITKSANPFLVIKGCGVQFCTNANPIGYDYNMDEVPYWRLYSRNHTIVDSRFDEPLTLQELIDLLKEVNYKGLFNAFPRLSKHTNYKYTIYTCDEVINVINNDGVLAVQFNYQGKILYFDGMNSTDRRIKHKAYNRCQHFRERLFYKNNLGEYIYSRRTN